MVREAVEHIVENVESLAKLHRSLYRRFRGKNQERPTRLIKGSIADSVRRAKSYLRLKSRAEPARSSPQSRG